MILLTSNIIESKYCSYNGFMLFLIVRKKNLFKLFMFTKFLTCIIKVGASGDFGSSVLLCLPPRLSCDGL